MGACFVTETAWRRTVSAWQAPHTATAFPLRSPLSLEACGPWQARQAPSATGWWTRLLSSMAAIFWLWQVRHRSTPACRVLKGVLDVAGSWHMEHCPFATGGCTFARNMPLTFEPCGSWQVVQSAFLTG